MTAFHAPLPATLVEEQYTTLDGEPFICISNVDALPPFFMTIVSLGDFWLFVGSNAAFTAGRVNPDGGLFPYQTVDKLLRHPDSSGALTVFHVNRMGAWTIWEPWKPGARHHHLTRNLYKHVYGTDVVFEEINHDLGLRFTWHLSISDRYGLVRHARLENLTEDSVEVRYLDGLNHIRPPGLDNYTYAVFSNLGAAYMRHEFIKERSLAIYTMNSGFSDRAEACESLRAAAVWSIGLEASNVLLSDTQLDLFRFGGAPAAEQEVRGAFGGYFLNGNFTLGRHEVRDWHIVGDTKLDHAALVSLETELQEPETVKKGLIDSVRGDRRALRRKIASADGLQQTAQRTTCAHHFANTLFNCMRGGTLQDSYRFPKSDLASFLSARNAAIANRYRSWLDALPAELSLQELQEMAEATEDAQLLRLVGEYLPITFSRRHGDPSRPWNYFSISVKDHTGKPIYAYQGNWRDIFQNWEALAQSYPACIRPMISIFLNASTADGYNPLRISHEGIDWDTWDPEVPWSHFGYWGDHQIVYLLRLLETCERFSPESLAAELDVKRFCYAQVPYQIKPFADIVRDPRGSMIFDRALHKKLMERAATFGNDGKLMWNEQEDVLLVSLAEKLLVPLLAKLSNLVPGGGIWMNTQRPEWNDGNNALAGWGLSMVTVCHLRRYVLFLTRLFAQSTADSVQVSAPLVALIDAVRDILERALRDREVQLEPTTRFAIMVELGKAGEQYRSEVYGENLAKHTALKISGIRELLSAALAAIDGTIRSNLREDAMCHSYNALVMSGGNASVKHLPLMLEGQVALLDSGFLSPSASLRLLASLRSSALYRPDQNSYMLNPDREIRPFLSRNCLPANAAEVAPVLAEFVATNERGVVVADRNGVLHFNADLRNASDLNQRLDALAGNERWKTGIKRDRQAILDFWEEVFVHSEFLGRSGTMFGFEGLGCIYWHMVAKLLLAVQETYHRAMLSEKEKVLRGELADIYYQIRGGLGFTKSPAIYGAFPTDPYSHTPRDRGAQQPGMTGQVKEEILTRLGELGVCVEGGAISFSPTLLREDEFMPVSHLFDYVDLDGRDQSWQLPPNSLAFTFCQTPIGYVLGETAADGSPGCSIVIERNDGTTVLVSGNRLPKEASKAIVNRTGEITRVSVRLGCDKPGSRRNE